MDEREDQEGLRMMQRALRRHGPWLCVLFVGGMLVQGMVTYTAPAPRWDMLAWTCVLTASAFAVWRARRAPSAEREVRKSRWHYGWGLIVIGGVWAAAVVALFLGAGASALTPKIQNILAADPVIRSSEVTEVLKVDRDDSGRGRDESSYTIRHRVSFDSGTETVESTVESMSEISSGSTVWVLYVPGQPDLGGHAEESRDQVQALQGGRADDFWLGVTALNLVGAGLFAAMGLFGNNKPLRPGSRRGTLRCAPAAAGGTGISRHRPPEQSNSNNDTSERPEKSGPFVELALQDGATVRLFVHRSIESGALAAQLGSASGTLYWDARPPNRGADSTWALFVLDSGEEIPGVVQRSDSFTWQSAGSQVDGADPRPLERRPVLHPITWQPGVQSAAVPFLAIALAALATYACVGSVIALAVAWTMLPLALSVVLLFRGMRLDEAVTEPSSSVDLGKAR